MAPADYSMIEVWLRAVIAIRSLCDRDPSTLDSDNPSLCSLMSGDVWYSTIMGRVTRPRPEKIKSGSKKWELFWPKKTIANFFGEQARRGCNGCGLG